MKQGLVLGTVFVIAAATPAQAANLAVITSPPTLLNLFILIFAVCCLASSAKVMSLVRGGQLSRSWQMFAAGFAVLTICQLATLSSHLELILLPSFVVPGALVVMSGLFLFGIIETKRALG